MRSRVASLMVGIVGTVLLASLALAADEPANPLYEQLRRDGVDFSAKTKSPLPAPLMADDLDAAGQRAVLEKIVGRRFSVKDFVAKIGTAPHVYSVRKIAEASDDSPRAFAVDVSFVAHGSLDTVANRDFLEGLHKKQKDRKLHILPAAELDRRKLKAESSKRREERYSHGTFIVLDRVELRAALHTVVTRHADSLLSASRIDLRFDRDTDFPNQWRKITIDDDGQRTLGPAHPYPGAGGYLKITRLHEPEGALFVEYHVIYTEPKGWFGGADPLRSKVPAIIQSEVRAFRQELNKVKK